MSGTQIKPQKECAFSKTENHFSMGSVGFDHNAGTSACVDSIITTVTQARPGAFSSISTEIARSHGSSGQHYSIGPAVHETDPFLTQEQGFSTP